MNLIRDRVFLGAVCLILITFLTYFLLQLDLNKDTPFSVQLTSYLLVFNAVIASGWFAFGWIGGIVVLIFCAILIFAISLITGNQLYYLHLLPFSITTAYSFKYLNIFMKFQTEYLLKREKVGEEMNTLSKKIEMDRAQIEALELKLHRYGELKSVAENLSDIFSIEKVIGFLAEKSLDIVGKSTRALIYLVDEERQELILKHAKQPPHFAKIKSKKGDIFDKWVLRQNQPLIILDAAKDFRFSHDDISLEDISFKSLIAVPMVSHNKVIGLLRLDSEKIDAYNPDDLRLLDIIGDLGAVALHNNILYQRTTELAIKDGLTQLFVHRYFTERLESEIKRAQKQRHPLSILMIDIDHFKGYNDKYGHIAGDILLKHLAGLFVSIVGKGDIVARYGGEEFAVILFSEDNKAAGKMAQKIRRKVEEEPFYIRRIKTNVTVSIGVSTLSDNAMGKEDLLKIADSNLYRAKKEGRNKVCMS
ncbi:MAG: sensor domain-containing diguanylate cyclase [Candidatus Omnitrophica bacterium]|nr:sensor domain-containing diguanylate cyclase [Candidatus Omnitrophota bacterium]